MQGNVQAMNRASRWPVLAVLVAVALSGCKEQLNSHVSERDANDILATLYAARIRAHKSPLDKELWSVEVDAQDLQRALQVLRERGLPREQFANTGELFKKEGLVSTPSEERIRFIYALSQELAHTLSQIDGVVAARVHPVIPANDPLASQIRLASASVFIKHRHDANLQAMAPAIKNLVMRSIEGLTYDNISLTFVVAEEPVSDSVAVEAAGSSIWIIIGTLATLLLAALGGLAYLWTGYRRAIARGEPSTPVDATSGQGHTSGEPRRRALWSALFRPREAM